MNLLMILLHLYGNMTRRRPTGAFVRVSVEPVR